MQPPFLGSPLYDGAVIVVVFFLGLWITVRHDSKFGWVLMAIAGYWGYTIYQIM